MGNKCIYKVVFSIIIMFILVGIKPYASSVYKSYTTETTETTEVVPIIVEEKENLVASVFGHKEPGYSEVIKKIKNRENVEEEMMVFRFVDKPKCLIIGDSRVCGLRNINYGKDTDLIGISGAVSYNINDIAENLNDNFYDEIICWFSVNDYNILDDVDETPDIIDTINNINTGIFSTMNTIASKSKGRVYYIRNHLGKNVKKSDTKNRLFSEIESELNRDEKYIVIETVIDADSKYCYDGTHYTLEGSIMIMFGTRWQIEKLYKEEVKNGKES